MATNYTDLKGEIKAQIKPNGVGAITGQVLQDAMLNLVGATEAEMSALNAATDEKLAQLDQEWQSIKDAHFNIIVNPHVEVVDMGAATAATIEPDKLYIFGEVASLAIGVVAPQAGYAGNYTFIFQTPADAPTTLSLPLGVKFPKESDSMLSIKPNTIYQISILNNLAIATSWEV
jgi:hypothetical protein